jgi:hypothetical protein
VRAFSFLGFWSLDPCVLDASDRLLEYYPRKPCVSINVAC